MKKDLNCGKETRGIIAEGSSDNVPISMRKILGY